MRIPMRLPLLGLLLLAVSCSSAPKTSDTRAAGARDMYARCNLKVLKGGTITWVNWQAAPEVIPVGTPLEVSGGPENWAVRDPANGRVYTLQTGAKGEEYLLKFVRPSPVDAEFTPEIADKVRKGIAVVGMTREQVYVSMGPPTAADGVKTHTMTEARIMSTTAWVWRRKRFGKNLGVTFDAGTGLVIGTEAIWKK